MIDNTDVDGDLVTETGTRAKNREVKELEKSPMALEKVGFLLEQGLPQCTDLPFSSAVTL